MKEESEKRNWTETTLHCGKGDQEMKQMVLKDIDESLALLENVTFLVNTS